MRLAPLALVLVACGPGSMDGDAPLDARDAALPARMPISLAVDDGAGRRLELSSDPLVIRVVDRAGTPLVESAGLGLAVGLAPGGDRQFHEPMQDVPRGVRWSALATGVASTAASEGVLRDDEGNAARVTLSSEGPGELVLRVTMDDAAAEAAMMRLVLATDDGHYDGLGERFEGADARGHRVPMQLSVTARVRESGTNEAHVPVPFLVDSRGWGVFVQSREAGAFDVAATDPDEVRISFEGRTLQVRFFVADRAADVIAAYSRHTGLPRLPPRWAFAPQHWRNEWTDRAELEGDVATIRALDIPVTAFWIDNPWQTSYNDHVFDETRFPDTAGMLAWMRAQGLRPLVWSTPYLDAPEPGETAPNPAEVLYAEAAAAGHLITSGGDVLAAPSASGCCDGGGMIDFSSSAARDFWQRQLDPLVGLGVRAFKLDYGEDVVCSIGPGRLTWGFSDGRTNREMHNVYATLYHQPYRDALDAASEGGFLLVRASAWGGQTVADVIWPGDLDSDSSPATDDNVGGLPASISALVSLAASGFPSYAADTGGFRTAEDTPDGRPSRETLLRWAEHDAFSPFLQLGGGGESHNPWSYDDEAAAIYARLARAHMDLVPYFRILAVRAHETGLPPVLHPAMAYPDDRAGFADPHAYLIGEDLFVAAVVTPGATTRALHLPPGRWVHWLTGQEHEGDVSVPAPLGTPPVFVRVGAIVPLLPPDLDTLAEEDVEPPVVRPSDRPYLRARILPATGSITTEEGVTITVSHAAASPGLEVTVSGEPAYDVRMAIELDHAEPPIASVGGVTADGVDVAAAPDRAAVEAGCDGACWRAEGTSLWVSVRGAAPVTLAFR